MTADGNAAAGGDVLPAAETLVKPKGIAILGSHPETKMLAPFDDDWLVYACSPDNSPYGHSEGKSVLPKVHAWFEVHNPVFDATRPYRYLNWLKQMPVVFMRDTIAMRMYRQDGQPLFPNAVAYPEEEMKARFGPYCFTSSIAFIMAKAIVDAVENEIPAIGLWGIMQASKNEYINQKPGVQALFWEAHKAGLRVEVPEQAGHLFQPPPEVF